MDEAFFRKAYGADAANAAKQTWEQYWGWVKAFYEGKRFPPVAGWNAREKDLSGRLKGDAREKVLARTGDVGARIAAEWAKDNSVRRVGTDDLQGYGSTLERAAKSDAGDGAALLAALDSVDAELAKRAPK